VGRREGGGTRVACELEGSPLARPDNHE